jgi:hypothetical protein
MASDRAVETVVAHRHRISTSSELECRMTAIGMLEDLLLVVALVSALMLMGQ